MKRSYYSNLPAYVRYDKDLPSACKLFWAELTSHRDENGYIFAGNKYFCELLGVSSRTLMRWLKVLQEKNYILVEYVATKTGRKRYISIVEQSVPLEKFLAEEAEPQEDKPHFDAIIPSEIRWTKDLSDSAKILYAEIRALCGIFANCTASNKYFENLYGVDKQSVKNWLNELEERQIIERYYVYAGGQLSKEQYDLRLEKRIIRLVKMS